jgi:hypothetical protein
MAKLGNEIRDLFRNVTYAWQQSKNPYLDNIALKKQYLETRERYHQKVDGAQRNTRELSFAFNELASALEFSDASNLLQRKAGLAKSINDNKDDLHAALIGMISGYATSGGALIPIIVELYSDRVAALSNFFFWAALAVLAFGIYAGSFNQNRLMRLVKEHQDYTLEFKEITDLLEKEGKSRTH